MHTSLDNGLKTDVLVTRVSYIFVPEWFSEETNTTLPSTQ